MSRSRSAQCSEKSATIYRKLKLAVIDHHPKTTVLAVVFLRAVEKRAATWSDIQSFNHRYSVSRTTTFSLSRVLLGRRFLKTMSPFVTTARITMAAAVR